MNSFVRMLVLAMTLGAVPASALATGQSAGLNAGPDGVSAVPGTPVGSILSGTIVGEARWSPALPDCTAVHAKSNRLAYGVVPFTVSRSGRYRLQPRDATLAYFHSVFVGDFDAGAPLVNCVGGNAGAKANAGVHLGAGVTYFLVATAPDPDTAPGAFSFIVEGPGTAAHGEAKGIPVDQVVLTFEGLQNTEQVLDFYAGGEGGSGSRSMDNFGVSFSPEALALIDSDAPGGTGNFGGEPSPDTVLFFQQGSALMDVPAGFSTGFSFFYSAVDEPGAVRVFDGVNATGRVLATVQLPTTPENGAPDPNGRFSPFFAVGVSFSGTARSVDFAGTVDRIGFDNITFGSATPGGGISVTIDDIRRGECPRVEALLTVLENDEPALGLTASDFTLVDNDRLFPVRIESGGKRLERQVAVIWDVATATLPSALHSDDLRRFVDGIDTSASVLLLSPAVDGPKVLPAATASFDDEAKSGQLHDSVIEAVRRLEPRPGPRSIVVLSNRHDRSSEASLEDALAAARAAGIAVQTVALDGANRPALSALAAETGGRYHPVAQPGELDAVATRVKGMSNYRISWEPNLADRRTHTVNVTVESMLGADTDSATYDPAICDSDNEPPVADFSFRPSGLTVDFFDLSTDADGMIAQRFWDFGDGSFSTEQDPTHSYDSFGSFTVTLEVTDDVGDTDEVSRLVTLDFTLPPPLAVPIPPAIGDNDRLGSAIAGSADLFVVGAPTDDSLGTDAGLVATYRIENGQPVLEASLEVPDRFVVGQFGASIAQQGGLLTVGAPGARLAAKNAKGMTPLGAAIFERLGQDWRFKDRLRSMPADDAGDEFGAAVAMDGDTYIVGAPGTNEDAGAAYVFQADGDNFVQTARVNPPTPERNQRFGGSVAVSGGKGAIGAVGGPIGGARTGTLTLIDQIQQNLMSVGTVTGSDAEDGDDFGASVSIDGETVAVGAPGTDVDGRSNAGSTWVFDFDSQITELGRVAASDPAPNSRFGTAVETTGGNLVIGAPRARNDGAATGAVYLFKKGPGGKGLTAGFNEIQKIPAPDGQEGFGESVATGDVNVFTGAPETGTASGAAAVTAGLVSANRVLTPRLTVDPDLGCPGFYIGRVSSDDAVGRWSMEILLEPGVRPLLQGGLNLGGGYGNNNSPGFAAFNLANSTGEPQRVTIDLQVFKDPDAAYTVRLVNRTGGGSEEILNLERRRQDVVSVQRTLEPGFYAFEVFTSDAPDGVDDRGIFLVSLLTSFVDRPGGAFQGGVNVGGLLDRSIGNAGEAEGFGAFCIDTEQTVRFTTFGDDAFGSAGIVNLDVEVLDADRNVVVRDP
ncbi:MAG: PKD domain-containing protein [Pseudomonadota bacterium]